MCTVYALNSSLPLLTNQIACYDQIVLKMWYKLIRTVTYVRTGPQKQSLYIIVCDKHLYIPFILTEITPATSFNYQLLKRKKIKESFLYFWLEMNSFGSEMHMKYMHESKSYLFSVLVFIVFVLPFCWAFFPISQQLMGTMNVEYFGWFIVSGGWDYLTIWASLEPVAGDLTSLYNS